MKRIVAMSRTITRRYAQKPIDRLGSQLGVGGWGSKFSIKKLTTPVGKWNYVLRDNSVFHDLADSKSEYMDDLKKLGAKYVTYRYGDIYFYFNDAEYADLYRQEQDQFDSDYLAKARDFDVSAYKPNNSIIKKLMDYRSKGSKVNVRAIKDPNKLITYYYAAALMGWDDLKWQIQRDSKLAYDYQDEFLAIDKQVAKEDMYADSRTQQDIDLGMADTHGLFTFEDKNCWLPKSILKYFVDNDIPVHFGKRTSGGQYDHNGSQWSEIEHLTLFPESNSPISYDIVVHTNERADGSIPDTYTGNGTPERVSAKQIIEDLRRVVERHTSVNSCTTVKCSYDSPVLLEDLIREYQDYDLDVAYDYIMEGFGDEDLANDVVSGIEALQSEIQGSACIRTSSDIHKFWSLDVSDYESVVREIEKAAHAGATLDDVYDYLDELFENGRIEQNLWDKLSTYARSNMKGR